MKKLAVIILIGVLAISCQKSEDVALKNEKNISLSEAEVLVREYLAKFNTNNELGEFSLKLTEVTTSELYSRFETQFYKVSSDHPLVDKNLAYVTKGKKAWTVFGADPLSKGSSDFKELFVADLNNDNIYEIYFISSWQYDNGERTGVRCLPNVLEKDFQISIGGGGWYPFPNSEFTLEKIDDQNLFIRYKDADFDLRVGRVRPDEGWTIVESYWEQMPKELRERILPHFSFN